MQNININKNASILITGGTGSFGRRFVAEVLRKFPKIKRLVVYSRDELKQFEMEKQYSTGTYPGLRYFLGDIRDEKRLNRALKDIEIVIHAAALKQVSTAEYNPFEYVHTNIIGAQNLIESCLENGIKKVIALSTDKASAPINLYGATKLCSDKLFIAANNISGKSNISFSVVRYGNVMGSRGSVIPYFLELKSRGSIPITSREMTRFNITLGEAVEIVFWAIKNQLGGEIFIPKIPSYRIMDLARAIAPNSDFPIVGIRPGEKIHEEMITQSDSINTIDIGKYYIILPNTRRVQLRSFAEHYGGKSVEPGFSYSSQSNGWFLDIKELRELIKIHVESEHE